MIWNSWRRGERLGDHDGNRVTSPCPRSPTDLSVEETTENLCLTKELSGYCFDVWEMNILMSFEVSACIEHTRTSQFWLWGHGKVEASSAYLPCLKNARVAVQASKPPVWVRQREFHGEWIPNYMDCMKLRKVTVGFHGNWSWCCETGGLLRRGPWSWGKWRRNGTHVN